MLKCVNTCKLWKIWSEMVRQCSCFIKCLLLPVLHILDVRDLFFRGPMKWIKADGELCYLSLHVCLCCCLSVKADSRVSAISLLPSPSWPSSSTRARKSIVWKKREEIGNGCIKWNLRKRQRMDSMTWTSGKTCNLRKTQVYPHSSKSAIQK